MKKTLPLIIAFVLMMTCFGPAKVFADAVPGDVVVTLGADLTPSQRASILNEMAVDQNSAQIIEVTNSEEHKYLDNYLSRSQIGTRAISSSKITLRNKGEGLTAETHNITYVSRDMYINALATAGVKDADVYVTAPFPVSGTAALTGLIKAYEKTTGNVIPEAKKQVANEEMVRTAELGNKQGVGKEKAAQLVTVIKDKIAKEPPKTDADMEKIVRDAAQQVNVNLSDADVQKLVDLFDKMKSLNINWNQMGDQMQQLKDKIHNLANSDQAKGFLAEVFQAIGNFISAIFNALSSLFK
ncbi:DUF1002 domain-containing protein [Sporolactobacillus sp. THM7-4]|nr:DUF1002 domain-containing protein [Sporolactobacillus sp. THM7-4]